MIGEQSGNRADRWTMQLQPQTAVNFDS